MSERVKEIRERADRASPGPWLDEPASEEWKANGPANYDFCRHAREDIPFLLAELERLAKERDAWKHTAEVIGKRPNPEMERLHKALGVAKEGLDKIVGTAQVPLHMVGIRAPSSRELMQWRRDYDMEVAREALTQISRIEAGGDGKE